MRLPYLLLAAKIFIDNPIFFLLPLHLTALGLSGMQQGILLALLTVTSLLTTFVSGVGNDRISTRGFILVGFTFSVAFYAGLSVTTTFWPLFVLFFIGGVGTNLTYTSITSAIFKTHEETRKGAAFGDYWFSRAVPAGIGLLLMGFALSRVDFPVLFAFAAAGFVIVWFMTLRLDDTMRADTTLDQYTGDLFRREVLLLGAVLFLFTLHWGAEVTSYSLLLANDHGLSRTWLSVFMATPIILLGLASRNIGRAIDINGTNPRFFLVGLVLSGFGHIAITYPLIPVSFAFRIVHEIGDALVVVYTYVVISTMFSRERVGGDSAFVATIMVMGQFAGILVFAPLGATHGYALPHILSGLACILAAALALRIPLIQEGLTTEPTLGITDVVGSLIGRPQALSTEVKDDEEVQE